MTWWERGACRGRPVVAWVPVSRPHPGVLRPLLEVCAGCPVLAECHEDARTTHGTVGIWGGRWWGPVSRGKAGNGARVCLECRTIYTGTCDGCGKTPRRDQPHRRQYAPAMVANHGTRSGYVQGCRCDLCQRADAEYQAARYRAQRWLEGAA